MTWVEKPRRSTWPTRLPRKSDNDYPMKKTKVLRKAILARRAVAVVGCHDAMSARVIETCGFEAIQISGYGLAASLLGKPDVGLVQMKDILDLTWNIVESVG